MAALCLSLNDPKSIVKRVFSEILANKAYSRENVKFLL